MEASKTRISDIKLLELPKIKNRAGNITAINSGIEVPFDLSRVYYLYDIPGGEDRGAHGHKALKQLIMAVSGSFSIKLTDGKDEVSFNLKRPYEGLLIPPGLWRELYDFSSGSICLVLASDPYDENDYIRSKSDFLNFKDI